MTVEASRHTSQTDLLVAQLGEARESDLFVFSYAMSTRQYELGFLGGVSLSALPSPDSVKVPSIKDPFSRQLLSISMSTVQQWSEQQQVNFRRVLDLARTLYPDPVEHETI
ncbi:MAG: hypothetical protein WD992_01500 [Candidatus Levyibacteriota bacterium]